MKKNIVMILTDQMHKNALGIIDPQIITPNLDKLANDSTVFTNAYANNPVCGPFRGNLFTGRYTKDNRVYRNNDPLPHDMKTMAEVFNENGYDTSFVGKWHLGGNGNCPIPEDLRGGFNHFIGYQCYNGFWVENAFYDEDNVKHTFDGHRTDITTALGIERLQNLAQEEKAFLHVIFYQAPHYPEQPSDEYALLYENVNFKLSPNYIETDPYTPTYDPRSARPYKYCSDYQRYGGNMREYKRLYNGMVSQIDHGVGQIVESLKELNIYDDTMILFSSDHGDLQGSHGLLNKCQPYEESCGIPLIVKGNGYQKGVKSDVIVSSMDYFTSVIAYAGIEKKIDLEGRDLLDLSNHADKYQDNVVFAENYSGNDLWVMMRDNRYKLVVDSVTGGNRLLFDMLEDPFEMNNLVANKYYLDTINRLRMAAIDNGFSFNIS